MNIKCNELKGVQMRRTTAEYIVYLRKLKEISKNTEMSYRSDLDKMIEYYNLHGIFDYDRINETNINSYILYLELKGNSSATITRNIAVLKGYFDYLFKMHKIPECITDNVKRPIVTKNLVLKSTKTQVAQIMEAAASETPKGLRDLAILYLFCSAGVQVSELIGLKLEDINLQVGYVQCYSRGKSKTYRISEEVKDALEVYLENGRPSLITNEENTILFGNVRGEPISRQGVWKMVKTYAKAAGIEEVNPAKLCKAFEK